MRFRKNIESAQISNCQKYQSGCSKKFESKVCDPDGYRGKNSEFTLVNDRFSTEHNAAIGLYRQTLITALALFSHRYP